MAARGRSEQRASVGAMRFLSRSYNAASIVLFWASRSEVSLDRAGLLAPFFGCA